MSFATKLREYLDSHKVQYTVLPHPEAFTAQEVAAVTHIGGHELAKAVIVRKNKTDFVMVVLPASCHIDFAALKDQLGTGVLELATEGQFKGLFPDCEAGAMPPFGNLYDIPVFVDESLTGHPEIAFNACTHRHVIRMRYEDFERLVHPAHLKCAVLRPASHH